MNVKELIKVLEKMPEDALVVSPGRDHDFQGIRNVHLNKASLYKSGHLEEWCSAQYTKENEAKELPVVVVY